MAKVPVQVWLIAGTLVAAMTVACTSPNLTSASSLPDAPVRSSTSIRVTTRVDAAPETTRPSQTTTTLVAFGCADFTADVLDEPHEFDLPAGSLVVVLADRIYHLSPFEADCQTNQDAMDLLNWAEVDLPPENPEKVTLSCGDFTAELLQEHNNFSARETQLAIDSGYWTVTLDAGDPKCLKNQDAVDVLRSEGLLK